MDIKESDWKIFRELQGIAVERYCERVLKDVTRTIDRSNSSYHERYLKLWKLLHDRDQTLAAAFDNARRSQAITQLVNIVKEDLLTDAELAQFSEETRNRIVAIQNLRDNSWDERLSFSAFHSPPLILRLSFSASHSPPLILPRL